MRRRHPSVVWQFWFNLSAEICIWAQRLSCQQRSLFPVCVCVWRKETCPARPGSSVSHALLTGNSSELRLLSNTVGQPGFPSLPERREGWANVPTDRFRSICPAFWSAGSMAAFPDLSLTVLTCRELHSHGRTPLSARSGVICTTKGSDGCFLVWDSKVQSSPVGLMHQGCHKRLVVKKGKDPFQVHLHHQLWFTWFGNILTQRDSSNGMRLMQHIIFTWHCS